MFIYFLISKISQWVGAPQVSAVVLGIVFLLFYFEGMRGTIIWHRLKRQAANQQEIPDFPRMQ